MCTKWRMPMKLRSLNWSDIQFKIQVQILLTSEARFELGSLQIKGFVRIRNSLAISSPTEDDHASSKRGVGKIQMRIQLQSSFVSSSGAKSVFFQYFLRYLSYCRGTRIKQKGGWARSRCGFSSSQVLYPVLELNPYFAHITLHYLSCVL